MIISHKKTPHQSKVMDLVFIPKIHTLKIVNAVDVKQFLCKIVKYKLQSELHYLLYIPSRIYYLYLNVCL